MMYFAQIRRNGLAYVPLFAHRFAASTATGWEHALPHAGSYQTPSGAGARLHTSGQLGKALPQPVAASESDAAAHVSASSCTGTSASHGQRQQAQQQAPPPQQQQQQAQQQAQLDFNDYSKAFSSRSTMQLLRAYLVLKACGFPALVKHADTLLAMSRHVLGDKLTFGIVRQTFFKHFCAGESDKDIWPVIKYLQSQGVGAILDYAAEDDVGSGNDGAKKRKQQVASSVGGSQSSTTDSCTTASATASASSAATTTPPQQAPTGGTPLPLPVLMRAGVVARTYDYASELQCDRHVETFLKAISTAAKLPGQGFAAVKMTALGNPVLLERMSASLLEIQALFRMCDADGSGTVSLQEYQQAYQRLFPDTTPGDAAKAFKRMDTRKTGQVDYIAWCQRFRLVETPRIADRIRQQRAHDEASGQHQLPGDEQLQQEVELMCLTDNEVELAEAMMRRVRRLADAAADGRVKLMVDAEHTYFQPAIDHVAKELQRRYNRHSAVVFNTYQCYLRDAQVRLMDDLERSDREGLHFGCKLVRGAYMHLERQRAQQLGYDSPVWDTLEQTHDCYNSSVALTLRAVAQHGAEVMVASHNQRSIELAVAEMARLGLDPPSAGVYFGQLLGMSDNLTIPLGSSGYRAYKYVPYGPIHLVMPYLVRRAQENSGMMAGLQAQVAQVRRELLRRSLGGWVGRG